MALTEVLIVQGHVRGEDLIVAARELPGSAFDECPCLLQYVCRLRGVALGDSREARDGILCCHSHLLGIGAACHAAFTLEGLCNAVCRPGAWKFAISFGGKCFPAVRRQRAAPPCDGMS